VHWSTAALLGICILTAFILYFPPLEEAIGRRRLVELIHTYSGFALPAPILLGWLSRAFRLDLRRLNRFSPQDWDWLRSRDRRSGRVVVGKFNAGQKLNAAFTVGVILVMLGSGIMLFWPGPWPLSLRIGATFTHDWIAVAIFVVVVGHMLYALRDPDAFRGMRTGEVPRSWAKRHYAGWLAEQDDGETSAVSAVIATKTADKAADPTPPPQRDSDLW
jgi:formate dehydrogenase subunit gamma